MNEYLEGMREHYAPAIAPAVSPPLAKDYDIDSIKGECGNHMYLMVKGWIDDPFEILQIEWRERDDGHSQIVYRNCYGAKLQTAFSRGEDLLYEFRDYGEPGRGRFKCTLIGEPDQVDPAAMLGCPILENPNAARPF